MSIVPSSSRDLHQLRSAIASGLQNQDGWARTEISSVYQRLSYVELQPLLSAVLEAIEKPAPAVKCSLMEFD